MSPPIRCCPGLITGSPRQQTQNTVGAWARHWAAASASRTSGKWRGSECLARFRQCLSHSSVNIKSSIKSDMNKLDVLSTVCAPLHK